jgi:hypothetical protein
MNMDLAPLYVIRGRMMFLEWESFIKLFNRRLIHNLLLKPCCRSCLHVTHSLLICDPCLRRKCYTTKCETVEDGLTGRSSEGNPDG